MANTPRAANAIRRVALVTGASYGLGAAVAKALARDGFDIALTATKTQNLDATLTDIGAARRHSLPIELDLRSQTQIEHAVATVIETLGQIDVLINNAGTNLRRRAIDVTRDEWDNVLGINLTGSFFLTQCVGRHLIARRVSGSIVTVSSTHAFVGATERSTYGISKAALIQMTRMLAIEWAEHNIRVNAVAPGRLDTSSPSRRSDKSYMEAMLQRIPLHRLANAAEVADVVAFLASPSAASITGQTIVIDGGLTSA